LVLTKILRISNFFKNLARGLEKKNSHPQRVACNSNKWPQKEKLPPFPQLFCHFNPLLKCLDHTEKWALTLNNQWLLNLLKLTNKH